MDDTIPPSTETITTMKQPPVIDRYYGSTSESHHDGLPISFPELAATVGSEYYTSISSDDSADTSASWSFATLDEVKHSEVPTSNQPDAQEVEVQKRNSANADIHLSMVSNFSAAYNTVNISLALTMMQSFHPTEDSSSIAKCSSALIAGMILGQLGGGLLGDWLGRHMAMAVVMTVQIGAAFMSAWSGLIFVSGSIHSELACWRFLLGVGCGGVYPLAATITAESSSETCNKGKSVALMFSFQGVGYLAVSMIAYFLVCTFGEESDLAWRSLLGLGSLPGLVLIITRLHIRRRDAHQTANRFSQGNFEAIPSTDTTILINTRMKQPSQVRLPPPSLLEQILNEQNLLHKIIGTAGCWLLFDILFYGNTLFQPVVLSAAFGKSETIRTTVCDSIFISLMALPGYFVSVVMVGRQSPKRIQLQGFLCMAGLYTAIGLKFDELNRISLLGLYGLTFFFSNYGPNSTTFMLPSMTFSRPCRATLNGICAACGKFGALLGSCIFLPLATRIGNAHVMLLCAMVSLFSAVLTFIFTDDDATPKQYKGDATKAVRVSSEAYLVSLQEDLFRNVPKTVSMPTFLDLH